MDEIEVKQARARRNILRLTIGIVLFVLIVNVGLGTFLANSKQGNSNQKIATPPQVVQNTNVDTFSYQGEEGKDALYLLKLSAESVEQNGTGLVIAINNRKADDSKKEYWAFYVNGKMAEVGPADYKTKNGDRIEWKIEKY